MDVSVIHEDHSSFPNSVTGVIKRNDVNGIYSYKKINEKKRIEANDKNEHRDPLIMNPDPLSPPPLCSLIFIGDAVGFKVGLLTEMDGMGSISCEGGRTGIVSVIGAVIGAFVGMPVLVSFSGSKTSPTTIDNKITTNSFMILIVILNKKFWYSYLLPNARCQTPQG